MLLHISSMFFFVRNVTEFLNILKVGDKVLLCGGRDEQDEVRSDCLAYDPQTNGWTADSDMISAREEAASVVLGEEMFVLGGFLDDVRSQSSVRYSFESRYS